MEWRTLAGGILFSVVLSLAAILALNSGNEVGSENSEMGSGWQELAYARLGNYMRGTAIAISVRSPKNKSVAREITAYVNRPPREIVYLRGPWVGAERSEIFESVLAKKATEVGFEFYVKNISEYAPSAQARIVILPSGAWPAEFEYEEATKTGCVAYVGLRKNITILRGGETVEGGMPKTILEIGKRAEGGQFWEVVGGRMLGYDGTVDEILNMEEVGAKIIEKIITCPQREAVAHSKIDAGVAGPDLVVLGLGEKTPVWARIVARSSDGKILRVWDEYLPGIEGEIEPAEIGDRKTFRVQALAEQNIGHGTKYSAVVYNKEYEKIVEIPIGRMNFTTSDEGQRQVFVSSFYVGEASMQEFIIVEMEDQYGQIYARTFVVQPKYEVFDIGGVGQEKRFVLMNGSGPIRQQQVMARILGGVWTRVPVRDGKVSVAGNWKDGKNIVEFDIAGQTVKHEWEGKPESALARFVKMSVWLVPVFVGLGIFVAAKKKEEYAIVVEHEAEIAHPKFELSQIEIEKIVGRPMTVEEIAREIRAKFLKKEQALSTHSVQEALEKLCAKGVLSEHSEMYAKAKEYTWENVREEYIERKLRDLLLEVGVGIDRRKDGVFVDDRNRRWKIGPVSPQGTSWKRNWEVEFVVFANEAEVLEFERNIPYAEIAARRLRLAKILKKTRFLCLEDVPKFSKYG